MLFSPRLHGALIRTAWEVDDGRMPMAEVWRRVGRFADGAGLPRPSYESIRRLVRAERARRAEMREELLAAARGAFRRVPAGLRALDHLWTAALLTRPSRLEMLVRARVESSQAQRPPPPF
jgi:hypothetical protein